MYWVIVLAVVFEIALYFVIREGVAAGIRWVLTPEFILEYLWKECRVNHMLAGAVTEGMDGYRLLYEPSTRSRG
jgi:hypothetical protein